MMLLLLVVVLLFFVLLVLLLLLLLLLSRGPYGRLASRSICYTLKTKLLLVLFVLSVYERSLVQLMPRSGNS